MKLVAGSVDSPIHTTRLLIEVTAHTVFYKNKIPIVLDAKILSNCLAP